MARTLNCPNCGESFGKDTENPMHLRCGNCGCKIYNERGEKQDGESPKKQKDEEYG